MLYMDTIFENTSEYIANKIHYTYLLKQHAYTMYVVTQVFVMSLRIPDRQRNDLDDASVCLP